MRARWWMAVGVAMGLVACREERMPAPVPGTPPAPQAEGVSDMNRAGLPAHQGATPGGRQGEGPGFHGEDSAVKELPPGEPINVGTPGVRSPEQPPPEREQGQERR